MDYDQLVVPACGVPHLSSKTVVEYQKIFRDMISEEMMDQGSQDYMVGGVGTTIEIDESQYGSYKIYSLNANTYTIVIQYV